MRVFTHGLDSQTACRLYGTTHNKLSASAQQANAPRRVAGVVFSIERKGEMKDVEDVEGGEEDVQEDDKNCTHRMTFPAPHRCPCLHPAQNAIPFLCPPTLVPEMNLPRLPTLSKPLPLSAAS